MGRSGRLIRINCGDIEKPYGHRKKKPYGLITHNIVDDFVNSKCNTILYY